MQSDKGSFWRQFYIMLGDMARAGDTAGLQRINGELAAILDDLRTTEAGAALVLGEEVTPAALHEGDKAAVAAALDLVLWGAS